MYAGLQPDFTLARGLDQLALGKRPCRRTAPAAPVTFVVILKMMYGDP